MRCFRSAAIPGDEDKAREVFPKLDQAKTREDFVTATEWLKARPETNGKLGAVGFCYGGGMVNFLATRLPDLAAGVPFYGSSPNVEDVPKIKAAMVIQSAEVDERINASWPAYEAALKAANVRYERHLVSRHAARLQQRHHAALRRRRRQAGVGANGGNLQQVSSLDRSASAGHAVRGSGRIGVSKTMQTGYRVASSTQVVPIASR